MSHILLIAMVPAVILALLIGWLLGYRHARYGASGRSAGRCTALPERHTMPYPDRYTPHLSERGATAYIGKMDHADSKYYVFHDFYNMKSEGTLHILSHFETYQQTTEYTCGAASALMVLNWFHAPKYHELLVGQLVESVPILGIKVENIADFFDLIDWNVEYHAAADTRFDSAKAFEESVIRYNFISLRVGAYGLFLFSVANTYVGAVYYLFCGSAEAMYPMVGVYSGENNPAAMRKVFWRSIQSSMLVVVLLLIFTWIFAAPLAALFGARNAVDIQNAAYAIRIFSTALLVACAGHTVCTYYTVTQHTGIAFLCTMLKGFVLFYGCIVLLGIWSVDAMWFGMLLSESITLVIKLFVAYCYSRKHRELTHFLLLDKEREAHTLILNCSSDMNEIMQCRDQAEDFLTTFDICVAERLKCVSLIEEMGVILSQDACLVEITVFADTPVMMIIRDSVLQQDVANTDNRLRSMQQYAALQLVNHVGGKDFFMTIGYNKTIFTISEQQV